MTEYCAVSKWLAKHAEWAPVFLRLGVGIVFLVHGLGKLLAIGPAPLGLAGTAGFLASIGVPAAGFFAWVVALVETLGGLALILGLFVRYAALLLAVVMLVAIVTVHWKNGFILPAGYEYALTLLAGSLTLMFSGAGSKWNLEHKFCKKEC